MPLITKISTQQKKGRFNVEVDNKFAFGVSETLLARENLYKGKELSLQQVEKLKQESEADSLYEKALNYLSYRPRSKRELEQYLRSKVRTLSPKPSYPSLPSEPLNESKLLESVISRLEAQNYLNDNDFATWWVEQRTSGKIPKGVAVIKSELFQKGIDRTVIEQVLNKVESKELVKQAAAKQAVRYKNLEEKVFKNRLSGWLTRRGFSWEQVKPVVDEQANNIYSKTDEYNLK